MLGVFLSLSLLLIADECATQHPIEDYFTQLTARAPSTDPGYSRCALSLNAVEEICQVNQPIERKREPCREEFENTLSNCQKPFELYDQYIQETGVKDCEPTVHGEIVEHMDWLHSRFDEVKDQLIEILRP